MNDITDIDLDINNLLEQIPSDENNGYIYIRIHTDDKQSANVIVKSDAAIDLMANALLSIIEMKGNEANCIFSAVGTHLIKNPTEKQAFLDYLERNKNFPNK